MKAMGPSTVSIMLVHEVRPCVGSHWDSIEACELFWFILFNTIPHRKIHFCAANHCVGKCCYFVVSNIALFTFFARTIAGIMCPIAVLLFSWIRV